MIYTGSIPLEGTSRRKRPSKKKPAMDPAEEGGEPFKARDVQVMEAGYVVPLRLYSQHFIMGKPQKYTQPCKQVAGLMTRAMNSRRRMPGDFNRHLRTELIAHKESKGLKEKPYLANGQLLTRIAYQALGMIDELPKKVTQENVSHEVGPMKVKPVSMIIPPREKSRRTLYKGGKPARAADVSMLEAREMEEEESASRS